MDFLFLAGLGTLFGLYTVILSRQKNEKHWVLNGTVIHNNDLLLAKVKKFVGKKSKNFKSIQNQVSELALENELLTGDDIAENIVTYGFVKKDPTSLCSLVSKVTVAFDQDKTFIGRAHFMTFLHVQISQVPPVTDEIFSTNIIMMVYHLTALLRSLFSNISMYVPLYSDNTISVCDLVVGTPENPVAITVDVCGDSKIPVSCMIKTALHQSLLQKMFSLKDLPRGYIIIVNAEKLEIAIYEVKAEVQKYLQGVADDVVAMEVKQDKEHTKVYNPSILNNILDTYERKMETVIKCDMKTAKRSVFEQHLTQLPYLDCFLNYKSTANDRKHHTDTSITYAKMRSLACYFSLQTLGFRILDIENINLERKSPAKFVPEDIDNADVERTKRWNMYITVPHAERFFEELESMQVL